MITSNTVSKHYIIDLYRTLHTSNNRKQIHHNLTEKNSPKTDDIVDFEALKYSK